MRIHQSRTPLSPELGSTYFYETYVENPFYSQNSFIRLAPPATTPPWPKLDEVRHLLPQPHWAGHEDTIACYWKVWEIAFRNFRRATAENGFVSDYNATAFNDSVFMWDSAFITLFGRYGRHAWNFQGTLDNFYAKQHPDGFICREIYEVSGYDRFLRFDPSGTGPNVLPWAEWEYYQTMRDRARLEKVFAPLAAYTRWFRLNRTWPDGSYWGTGWSTGMDNQPRVPAGRHVWYDHGHMAWVDTCMQAVLADKVLVAMAKELGREEEAAEFSQEATRLAAWINAHLWSDTTGFYHDRHANGSLLESVKTIGAYWALLAGIVPPERMSRFVAHLDDPKSFARAHRVASLSADSPGFDPRGGYWLGGVWAPTNYMVLRGLTKLGGNDKLAHEIGVNHVANVVQSFLKTGTLWENYAPDLVGEGNSGKDFVGWTGVPPVAVLLEYVFGLRPEAERLVWDVRLTEAHGVDHYPIGDATVSLHCAARKSTTEAPSVRVDGKLPCPLEVRWDGGSRML